MNSRTANDTGDESILTSSDSQDQLWQKLHSKITYIQSQIDSLPEYLPESYQYLMGQLDRHQQQLLALILQEEFNLIESTSTTRNDEQQ